MSEMKSHSIKSSEAGSMELAPYGSGTAWLEVNNTNQGGFFVLDAETASELAMKLTEWVESLPPPKPSKE